MAIRPYLVPCKRCGTIHARNNRIGFVCITCKNPKAYPSTFYKNRLIVLKRDNNECQCCKTNKKLIVHHLDCNPKNNSPSNLIVLCNQCHSHLHNKYGNKKLRESNIYKLFPKILRHGEFGTRFDKGVIKRKVEKEKPLYFKNTDK